ncbi:MAG: tRNA epoxyqueuosine(34) reductase QueG [Chloroflexi bacterium]|nr:tRNA epoxyqueuosine(34) reductase QueG [Chloroflexota bacterium]
MSLTARILDRAHNLGFDLVGVALVNPVPHLDAYRSWIAQGYHGGMGYMARPDRVERRKDPGKIVPGARSVICVGLNYYSDPPSDHLERHSSFGLISNYAWGIDYHDLMTPRLESLTAFIGAEMGRRITHRTYVDTGPVLERAYAARAGLGFIGKNTCLIHPKMGSWLFLGEILVDAELDPTTEQTNMSCGTCRRCLDACPTGALVAPYVLDARRCISYLTIELKGAIPHEFRSLMGSWIYGCDVCQAVCPWQRFARPTREQSFWADVLDRAVPALLDLVGIGEESFQQRYKDSPIFRIGRQRLLRNTAVALGNWGDEQATPMLIRALADAEPLLRGHAAWALGCIGGQAAQDALENSLQDEQDSHVQREMQMAVSASSRSHDA